MKAANSSAGRATDVRHKPPFLKAVIRPTATLSRTAAVGETADLALAVNVRKKATQVHELAMVAKFGNGLNTTYPLDSPRIECSVYVLIDVHCRRKSVACFPSPCSGSSGQAFQDLAGCCTRPAGRDRPVQSLRSHTHLPCRRPGAGVRARQSGACSSL